MGMKEAYQQKLDARVREWQARIDLLKSKAEESEADQKIKYYKQIESLRLKQQKMSKKLEELQSSGTGAFKDVKAGVAIAWEDLKTAVERAVGKFK